MLNNLPHAPEAAHALIRQKLNEHTDALREVKEENIKQKNASYPSGKKYCGTYSCLRPGVD